MLILKFSDKYGDEFKNVSESYALLRDKKVKILRTPYKLFKDIFTWLAVACAKIQ